MSEQSKQYRAKAATHLRKSRKVSGVEKNAELSLASSFKLLAENEEWFKGERPRAKRRGGAKKK